MVSWKQILKRLTAAEVEIKVTFGYDAVVQGQLLGACNEGESYLLLQTAESFHLVHTAPSFYVISMDTAVFLENLADFMSVARVAEPLEPTNVTTEATAPPPKAPVPKAPAANGKRAKA